MTRILIAAALIALPLTANAQAVVSNDCQLSRFIEASHGRYLRTVQQQAKKVCRTAV